MINNTNYMHIGTTTTKETTMTDSRPYQGKPISTTLPVTQIIEEKAAIMAISLIAKKKYELDEMRRELCNTEHAIKELGEKKTNLEIKIKEQASRQEDLTGNLMSYVGALQAGKISFEDFEQYLQFCDNHG